MPEKSQLIHPVIMCGGSGTRLWPASRDSMPKQFIELLEGESTFQATARRVSDATTFARPTVVTAADSRFIVAEQLLEAGVQADIVLEPMRRDSAAAVAVAACHAAQRDPEAVVLIMAADHVISDPETFVDACREASGTAHLGLVMTLGVRPTQPATAYGYIATGTPVEGTNAFQVASFVEKPDAATAQRYIDEGFLWNSGYFLFRADVMITELEAHAPAILAAARAAVERATIDLDFVRLHEEEFSRAPKTSIDYALMEKTTRAGVLPVSFSWSDIGTWDALWDASPRDGDGNAVRGNVEVVATRNSLVHSEGLLTAVVGIDDVVVVSTPDAVLVTSRERSGQVKDLVASLKAKHHREADEHLRMYRPWGWYQRIDIGQRFQVKRIMVKPGGRLSLQKHYHRAEHWVVVRGTAEVTVDDRVVLVHENEAVYLPIGCIHRLTNPGRIPLELIEVQVGSYTGEDDIIRVEDVYGR
ncbi:mannose-1-phosphate guanylyltransferase/mannose-6-phosphate isomerase [Salinarimonas soli]|uniref:mannose-1-phosphate guanylyltransferase n=1 Tax=Salinarimonas soli TaxID=1638099 RepID=A0A5B2V891_9HYPH|nr:mannose-1-phosphate guanylyltransferase/mannose-6-phosphate isomerase [Salinarimonas soli]KAA2235264.1 mannose-1-phosphate guanylyltransferase/mannose-6-phosphate isomerase [Salinarimonas soli]